MMSTRISRPEVWCPGLDLVVLRAAARSNNGWAKWVPQENLSFANGYWSFADSRGFALGGPDRDEMTNNQSQITNHQFFVLLLQLDSTAKHLSLVIGDWLLVIGYWLLVIGYW